MSDQQYLLVGKPEDGQGELRKGWWWQPGPVDNCCFCCSVGFGIGFLAVISTLHGLSNLFDLIANSTTESLQETIEALQIEWDNECSDLTVQTTTCDIITKAIASTELGLVFSESFLGHLAMAIGAIDLLYGIIGFVALCTRSPKWANWFYYASIASMVGTALMSVLFLPYCDSADYVFGTLFSIFICILFGLYFVKVTWSFFKVTEAEEANCQNSQPAVPVTGTYQAGP